jgi:hypothetical protein
LLFIKVVFCVSLYIGELSPVERVLPFREEIPDEECELVVDSLTGFGLGIGVGFASGFITALITVGLIFVIKSRVQASQLGSPRVRNVLPMQTPTSINGNISRMNGHVPNGEIINGQLPRNQRLSTTSSHSSSGISSRNGRTLYDIHLNKSLVAT